MPGLEESRLVSSVTLNPTSPQWLWLFPLAYFVHGIEEVSGVGAEHGINVSLNVFVILTAAAWLLMIFGIVLAQRFKFSQFIAVCLSTTVFLNGLSHIIVSFVYRIYDAGAISGGVIFIPLGLVTLLGLRNNMRRRRYVIAVVLGAVIQAIAMILAA